MISIKRTGQQFLYIVSLLSALVICLPGCTNNSQQTTGLKTSTKPSSETTGTSASTSVPSSPTIHPTREIWPVNMTPNLTGRITEMLKTIPDNMKISQDQIWFIDFAAWNITLDLDINDFRNPSGITTIDSEDKYIYDLILSSMNTEDWVRPRWYPWLGQPSFISGMGLCTNENYRDNGFLTSNKVRTKFIGYGPLDIECSILSSSIYKNTTGNYEVIKGDFDITAISHSFDQYQEDYQHPQVSSSYGINIYSWESDISNYDRSLSPPIFDFFGRGHTLAIQSDNIFGSQEPVRVDEMIEVSQGRMPSLADDPLYQELATKLENMGNMSAVISVDKILKPDLWPGKSSFFEKAASYALLMGPYTAFAAGLSVDEKGMFVSLVLLYESPDLAEHDIKVLKERLAAGTNSMNSPWAKEVDDSEIWADGNALCAKLYGNVTSYWDCFVHQEPLLVRGD
jgi:hypothetical protein